MRTIFLIMHVPVGRVRFGETEMAGERTEAMAEGSESPSSVSTPDGTHKTRD